MTLYNKYRPKTFEQIVGNAAQVKTVCTLLDNESHPHVWLFTGESGTGKTTFARIIADRVGVEETVEINSSNNRGIDTVREISENIRYPTKTAYILDEAHKITSDAQSAFLKILEDTPEYVWFLICTTNPEKLSTAFKTRCTEVNLQGLKEQEMLGLLKSVCRQEEKRLNPDTYGSIISLAGGSPRQALVLLESVIGIESPDEQMDILGKSESQTAQTITLCRALTSGARWSELASIIKNLETTDYESVRYAVLGYANSVLLNTGDKRCARILESFKEPYYASGKAGLTLSCYNSMAKEV